MTLIPPTGKGEMIEKELKKEVAHLKELIKSKDKIISLLEENNSEITN